LPLRTIFPSAIFAISDCCALFWWFEGGEESFEAFWPKFGLGNAIRLLFHLQLQNTHCDSRFAGLGRRRFLSRQECSRIAALSKDNLAPQSRQLSQVLSFNESAHIRFNYGSIFCAPFEYIFITTHSSFSLAPHFLIAALRCGAAARYR
jgi:hypothetical protein